MKTLVCLLVITFSLTACLTVRNQSGEVHKITLNGLEKVEKPVEPDRKNLPHLDIGKFYGGFKVDGKQYVDPYGHIIHLSEISDTGFVTYTVQGQSDFEYVVKLVTPTGSAPAKVIGLLEADGKQWHYTPTNGERFNGDWFRLASQGVLLNRHPNIVNYFSPGVPVKTHVLPEGFRFSPVQIGDISASKHLLIQRPLPPEELLGFVTLTTAAQPYEMGLFNIESGQVTAQMMDVRLRGKSVNDQMAHLENSYYLYNTVQGPIAISLEDGYQHLVVRNLKTGQKVIAFERERGISFPRSVRHNSGRIELSAKMGFESGQILDVENFLITGSKDTFLD